MLHVIEKPETIIAIVSLLISAGTFIFIYLRPPKIRTYLGPAVIVGYTGKGSGFSVHLPVTFFNTGAKAGSVFRTAILFRRQGSLNEQYFMQWDTFLRLDTQQIKERWSHEELAHVLMIPANSSIVKMILFGWPPSTKPALKFHEGIYELEFFFWSDDSTLPRYETHQISISPDDLAILDDWSDPDNLKTVPLQLDPQLELHKVKNQFDAQAVRKQTLKTMA